MIALDKGKSMARLLPLWHTKWVPRATGIIQGVVQNDPFPAY
jgi:hypothetical protein